MYTMELAVLGTSPDGCRLSIMLDTCGQKHLVRCNGGEDRDIIGAFLTETDLTLDKDFTPQMLEPYGMPPGSDPMAWILNKVLGSDDDGESQPGEE